MLVTHFNEPATAGNLPSDLDRVVDIRVASEIRGTSEAQTRRDVKAGRFPAPIRISPRRIGWRLSTIYAYLDKLEQQAEANAA